MINIPIDKPKEFLWNLAKDNPIFKRLDSIDKKKSGQDLFYAIVHCYHPYSQFYLTIKELEAKKYSNLTLVFENYNKLINQDFSKDSEYLKSPSFEEAIRYFKKEIEAHYKDDKSEFIKLKAVALGELIESQGEMKIDPETYIKKINCYNSLNDTLNNLK